MESFVRRPKRGRTISACGVAQALDGRFQV
jgi:hypothetical protein